MPVIGAVAFDTFHAAAGRYARYRAVERRLFEVVGGWVPTVAEPAAKVGLRVLSFGHARRAELWEGLLPVAWTDQAGAEATSELAGARPLIERAAALRTTPARLAAVAGGLLPLLARTYQQEAGRLSVAAGGPARRVLKLAGAALDADRELAAGLAADFPTPDGEEADRVLDALAEWHHLV